MLLGLYSVPLSVFYFWSMLGIIQGLIIWVVAASNLLFQASGFRISVLMCIENNNHFEIKTAALQTERLSICVTMAHSWMPQPSEAQ